jgi:hypothetical protein
MRAPQNLTCPFYGGGWVLRREKRASLGCDQGFSSVPT